MSPEAATICPWRKIFEEVHFKANLSLPAVDEVHASLSGQCRKLDSQ